MMRSSFFGILLLVVLAASVTTAATTASSIEKKEEDGTGVLNRSACDVIHPEKLPEECACTEPGPFSLVVECTKTFTNELFNDTIGMNIDIAPCNKDGSSIALKITEKDHDIEYIIAGIRAGEAKNIPIPGLSIAVPAVGHVGVDAAVYIGGNPDQLTMKIGLNACVAVGSSDSTQLCASSIPVLNKILPWYVLSGTYSFGHICNNTDPGMTVTVARE